MSFIGNLQNTGSDAKFDAFTRQTSVNQLNFSQLNVGQLTSNIRILQPSFQQADLQYLLNRLPLNQDSAAYGLQTLQKGFVNNLYSAANCFSQFAYHLQNSGGSAAFGHSGEQGGIGLQPTMKYPVLGSGGGAFCRNSLNIAEGFAYAFLIVGIMSGFGVIAEGAAWGAISLWGGGAATVTTGILRIGGC